MPNDPLLVREGRPVKSRKSTTMALLLVAAVAAGRGEAQRSAGPVVVEEQWCTAGNPATHEFVSITGAIELPNGSLWVSDPRGGGIFEVDGRGGMVKLAVKSGDGPGEVRSPYQYVRWADGLFAVYDAQFSSLEIYSPSGKFLRRISLGARLRNVKGMAALAGRGLLMSGGIAGNPSSIHVFDSTGALVRSLHPTPVTKSPRAGVMVAGGAVSAEAGGTVWFSQSAPHLIARLDPSRGTEVPFAQDPSLLAAIGDDFIVEENVDGQLVRSFRWLFPQSQSIFQVGDRVVNVIMRHDDGTSDWEVYDVASRRRLSLATVPRAYRVLGRTRSGDLIATRDDKESGQALLCRLGMRL